jgi:hypothetical protein
MRQNKKILSLIASLEKGGPDPGQKPVLPDIDWPAITESAEKHGMSGYFFSLFSQAGAGSFMSADALDSLKRSCRRIAVHNAFYESECAVILKGLSAAGIECLLLKGFSYMADIYGDTNARRMSDIDLLVRPDDRTRVHDYLLAEGYSAYLDPEFRGSRDEFIAASDQTGETHLIKKRGALTLNLDIHWRMQANFDGYPMNESLALDDLPWWENAGSVTIGGMRAGRLSPEMHFIHMAVHFAAHHQYCGLRWFIELCLFLKKFGNDLDWDYIYDSASSDDCRKLLGVCLRLAADCLPASLPGPEIWRRFLPGRSMLPGEYSFYKRCLMQDGRSMPAVYICMTLGPASLAGRMSMALYFLFDPRAVIFWRVSGSPVPKWLQPFYILYRLAGQLLRRGRA